MMGNGVDTTDRVVTGPEKENGTRAQEEGPQ